MDAKKAAKETVNAGRRHWIVQLYVIVVEAVIRIQNVNPLVRLKYIVVISQDMFPCIFICNGFSSI